MIVETEIAITLLAYSILSYVIFTLSKHLRDSLITVFSMATAFLLGYISIVTKNVTGFLGLFGTFTLFLSLLIGEMKKVERRVMISMLGVYFVGSSMLLVSTTLLFRLFIYWEIATILMVGSLAIYKKDEGYEAALKYAVICLPGSLIGLLGLVIAVSESGTFAFPQAITNASILSKMLITIGFGAEIALFPMYVWLPSIYVGMTPLLLSIEVSSVLPATVYIVGTVASASEFIALATTALALIGSLIGSLSAMVQNDFRKLLSYSTLSHIGYMIMGLSVGTQLARNYSLLHMVAHAIPKASLIMFTFILLSRLGSSKVSEIGKFVGVYKFIAIGSALALLGLPPFLSFWSELFIFLGTFSGALPWKIMALIYFIVIIISTGYSFRIIYSYSSPKDGESIHYGTDAYAILILLFFLLSLLISPFQSYLIGYFFG